MVLLVVVVGSAAGEQAPTSRQSATTLRVSERIDGTLGPEPSVAPARDAPVRGA